MKKILLLLTVFACFSFITIEEKTNNLNEIATIESTIDAEVFYCGSNSSPISSSCWSGCVSVRPKLTKYLSIDVKLEPRKPTAAEFEEAQEILDAYCNS